MMRVLAITVIVAYVAANVEAGTVLLHDPSSKILQQQVTLSSVTQAASTGALCAATALVPPYKFSDETAKQVGPFGSCIRQGLDASPGQQANQFLLCCWPCRSRGSCSTMYSTSQRQLCC
jgi:hypothetical protein